MSFWVVVVALPLVLRKGGLSLRGVEFKGGSRHDRNRHNRRNRQNRQNRHGRLLALYFVGEAKEGQGVLQNRQIRQNRHEGYPPWTQPPFSGILKHLETPWKYPEFTFCLTFRVFFPIPFENNCAHSSYNSRRPFAAGWVVLADVPPEGKPERGYIRMFPRNETGTRVHSHVPPERKPKARHNPEPRSEVWWWNLRWSFGGKCFWRFSPAKEARKSPSKLRRKFATNFAENFDNFTREIAGA